MRGLWVLAAAIVLAGCGDKAEGPDEEALSEMEASAASTLAKLEHDSTEKLPPYDKVPPVPVNGFCAGNDEKMCASNRRQMYEDWPKAWAGDYQAQRNVAYMQSQFNEGIPRNPVQGCAWRMVILGSGHSQVDTTDTSNYNFECRALTPVEFRASEASAGEIFKTIKGQALPKMPAPAV